jgi:hypothetical protein
MSGAEKLAEKVPGWVERLLIPTLEARVRAIVNEEVKEEVRHLEKTMNARFDGTEARFDAVDVRFDAVNERIDSVNERIDGLGRRMDSLEKSIPMIQDIADLKARLAVVEKRTAR